MIASLNPLAETVGQMPRWYHTCRVKGLRRVWDHPLIVQVAARDPGAVASLAQTCWDYMLTYGPEIAQRTPAKCPEVASMIGDQAMLRLVETHQNAIRSEEGSHAGLWRALAASHDVELSQPKEPAPALATFLAELMSPDHPTFYVGLTATQTIAWALSKVLVGTPFYQHGDKGWIDAHLAARCPTHEAMYFWMAWQLLTETDVTHPEWRFRDQVERLFGLFIGVADELWREQERVFAAA